MIRHMAGRELKEIFPSRRREPAATRLSVDRLSRAGKFSNVTFEAQAWPGTSPERERFLCEPEGNNPALINSLK
jgi:hypothetical protein